jgi:hypothetical protein
MSRARTNRSAMLGERGALPKLAYSPQTSADARSIREAQTPAPESHYATAEPPRPTGLTRRGDGAVRKLMNLSREATAAHPSPSLRSSKSALFPTGATASAYALADGRAQ